MLSLCRDTQRCAPWSLACRRRWTTRDTCLVASAPLPETADAWSARRRATGSTELGLLLTRPAQGSETDDGYLSTSEIARLKLDADWVILSACNTAAGEICAWEVQEAVRLGKCIIPVVCRELATSNVPPHLQDLNYIFFYKEPKAPDWARCDGARPSRC